MILILSIFLFCIEQRGDYLIVGIHGDALVNKVRGSNLPLLTLYGRVLIVLSCRFVDDVLIYAPYAVTSNLVTLLNIAEVLHGTLSDGENRRDLGFATRYKYPIEAGIFKMLESPSNFMVDKDYAENSAGSIIFRGKILEENESRERLLQ